MSTRTVCAAPVTPCEADLLTWSARFHKEMFRNAKTFNGDLSSWNVSNVTDMARVKSMRSMSTRIVCAAPVTPCEELTCSRGRHVFTGKCFITPRRSTAT